MKSIIFRWLLLFSAIGVLGYGCSQGPVESQPDTRPSRLPDIPYGRIGDSKITNLLNTDSVGCRVYEIERSNCWVYVNNNGGIVVLPKE